MEKASELGDKGAKSIMMDFCGYTPISAEDYYNKGIMERKNWQKAIENYNKAIELDPKYAAAYYGRGYSKFRLKDIEGACIDGRKAIDLGYTDSWGYISKNCK